jgi:hypothetical protein
MVHIKEIDQAIAAHGYWKTYLRNAIKTGQIDMPSKRFEVITSAFLESGWMLPCSHL